jgi:hypothetical protein
MKIKFLLSGTLLLLFLNSFCQEKERFPILVAVTNNATQMPGSGYLGIFTVPVHPGLSAGTQLSLKDWDKSSLLETFRLGGYYQKYNQLAFELYSELIYQYRFGAFAIEPQFQAGFMLAFSDLEEFKLNGESYEEKSFKGKPQFMAGAGFGISYTINHQSDTPVKLSLSYLVDLQMPYIKNYAPVLIISSLQLGVMFYLPCHHD